MWPFKLSDNLANCLTFSLASHHREAVAETMTKSKIIRPWEWYEWSIVRGVLARGQYLRTIVAGARQHRATRGRLTCDFEIKKHLSHYKLAFVRYFKTLIIDTTRIK
jgi:hypothetical protein